MQPIVPAATDNHGHARLLTHAEALRAYPGPQGLVLGELRQGRPGHGQLVIDPIIGDAGNGLMVAGNGAGKSTSLATMAMYWPGSAVILDPKGELAAMLTPALEADGRRVHVISLDDAGSGFNAIGWIDPTRQLASVDVRSVVSWIFPDDKADSRDPYFEPTGKALCAVILADLLWSNLPASEKTLATFRARMKTPEKQMQTALKAIAKHSASSYAREVASTLTDVTERQWSGVYGQATQHTEWLSDPDLSRLVSGDRFQPTDILDGNTFVFVQLPLKTLMQVPGIGRVLIGALLNTVYDAEGKLINRVGFFLDEAWVLRKMKIQEAATVTGRSFGITMIWFYQSIGQLREVWGDDGVATLHNNLTWRGYAAVRDHKTACEISEYFGKLGVQAWSSGDNTGTQRPPGFGWASRSSGTTLNMHEISRPLVMPQEILAAEKSDLFVISSAGNMILRTAMAHLRPELAQVVQPSPQYRPA